MRKLLPLLVLAAGFAAGCATTTTTTETVSVAYKNVQYFGGETCNGSSRQTAQVEYTQYPVFWETQEGYENMVVMFSPAISLTTPQNVSNLSNMASQLSDMLSRSGWYNVTDLTKDSSDYTSFQKDGMIAKVSSALNNNKASALIVLDNTLGEQKMGPNPKCTRSEVQPGYGAPGYGGPGYGGPGYGGPGYGGPGYGGPGYGGPGYRGPAYRGYEPRPVAVPPPVANNADDCAPVAMDTYTPVLDITDLSSAKTVTQNIDVSYGGRVDNIYNSLVPQKRSYPLNYGKTLLINSRRKGELASCEFDASDNIKMTVSLPEEFRMNVVSVVLEAACQVEDAAPFKLASFYWPKDTSKTIEITGQDLVNAVNCTDSNQMVVMNVWLYVENQVAANVPILIKGTPNGGQPTPTIEAALTNVYDQSNATLVSTFTKIVTDIDTAVKTLADEMKKAAEEADKTDK